MLNSHRVITLLSACLKRLPSICCTHRPAHLTWVTHLIGPTYIPSLYFWVNFRKTTFWFDCSCNMFLIIYCVTRSNFLLNKLTCPALSPRQNSLTALPVSPRLFSRFLVLRAILLFPFSSNITCVAWRLPLFHGVKGDPTDPTGVTDPSQGKKPFKASSMNCCQMECLPSLSHVSPVVDNLCIQVDNLCCLQLIVSAETSRNYHLKSVKR